MGTISRARVCDYFLAGANGANTTIQGRALEDLICYVFSTIPGVEIVVRNALNVFNTEEIDVAFWNKGLPTGTPFLPNVVLAECKNWNNRVGSQEVAYFASRLRNRGCEYGILIAPNGITGSSDNLTRAHFEMATALSNGQRILVLTRDEVESLTHSRQLVRLLKRKICELVVSGTSLV